MYSLVTHPLAESFPERRVNVVLTLRPIRVANVRVPDARPPHARSPLHVPQQVAKGWILSGENLEERRPREDLRLQFRRLLQLLLLARQVSACRAVAAASAGGDAYPGAKRGQLSRTVTRLHPFSADAFIIAVVRQRASVR
ncbi:hypothetical protein Y032_0564g3529 [Ancylostoma ceylanicum]|uniref:Uncharacterized protein n=1 Tax=Ancylostoma ceylanicum TaxID=53326 RepID=A0A016WQP4_9BILA|nr:hypothetical protein Y032_0564g3529 [Ancylostoma ceylanicum]